MAKSTSEKPVDPDVGTQTDKPDAGKQALAVDMDALKAELEAAGLAYDSAKEALAAPDAGDEQLVAFEAAEERLNTAEAALEEAGGE